MTSPKPSRHDLPVLERLRGIDASSLSDANKALRVMSSAIEPVGPAARMIGRAVTADAQDNNLASAMAALSQGAAGDVLVIGNCSADGAFAGELFATEALRRGMTGIVIDGLCRDTATLVKLALPVYARGATPRAPLADGVPRIQVPLVVGGVDVRPGEILLGDSDGIVVASESELESAIDAAEEIQAREDALRDAIAGGGPLFDDD